MVGRAVSYTIDRHLAIAAFRNAGANRHPGQRLVIHTDRGCQYTSWGFRREVASIGGIQSLCRPGTPYDSTCAETFFKTIKVECIGIARFMTREEASDAVSRYLPFYNRLRIHQSLGYLSPVVFERLVAA